MEVGSREVCKAAIQIALTDSREEEIEMKAKIRKTVFFPLQSISAVISAVRYRKCLKERLLRQNVKMLYLQPMRKKVRLPVRQYEAIQQIVDKCVGLNLGGKIGIARHGSHIGVCVFLLSVY